MFEIADAAPDMWYVYTYIILTLEYIYIYIYIYICIILIHIHIYIHTYTYICTGGGRAVCVRLEEGVCGVTGRQRSL